MCRRCSVIQVTVTARFVLLDPFGFTDLARWDKFFVFREIERRFTISGKVRVRDKV